MFLPLCAMLPLLMMFWQSFDFGPRDVLPSALIDKPLPEFSLPDLFSNELRTESEIYGRAMLINVWGSWCTNCLDEHPLLLRLRDEGVLIVGLNYKDDPAAAKQWLNIHGNPYEFVIVDQDGVLAIELGVYGVPSTFLVDADGYIRTKRVGTMDAAFWNAEMRSYF